MQGPRRKYSPRRTLASRCAASRKSRRLPVVFPRLVYSPLINNFSRYIYSVLFDQIPMASAGASLSSSPRLPSPPPFPEVQIGPKSPTISDGSPQSDELLATPHDVSATRRIRPGTKGADMASGPPLVPLAQVCWPVVCPVTSHCCTKY